MYLHETRHHITSFWFGLTNESIELSNSEFPLTQAQANNTTPTPTHTHTPTPTPTPASVETHAETDEEKLHRLLLSAKARAIAKIFRANNDPQAERNAKKTLIESCKPLVSDRQSPATGLALLTAYYVYSLFSNNLAIIKDEPGPKPNLGIMSRLSFSEMFQKLPLSEKELYKRLIIKCLGSFFSNKLVSYTSSETYHSVKESDRISFQQWYESIINSPKDLLSPPPGCHGLNPPYAMGAYDDFTEGHALLEVRAYSDRDLTKDRYVTIDNFCQFIDNEAKWFFSLQQTVGDNDETQ
jgi:hypothetical protein